MKNCDNCGKQINSKRKCAACYVIEWRRRKKVALVEFLGGKCLVCGYNQYISAMQFHHTDPSSKDFAISGSTKGLDTLLKEVQKCVLLCGNCHAAIHSGELVLPKD